MAEQDERASTRNSRIIKAVMNPRASESAGFPLTRK
jgi:hypothetical protein